MCVFARTGSSAIAQELAERSSGCSASRAARFDRLQPSSARLSRPNPEREWQSVEIPDLAIVPGALFGEAQCRKNARGRTHPNQQRRPRHLLSGLLRCGACGAGVSTNGKDKSGRIRIRCSAANENGTCRDAKTFYLEAVENAVQLASNTCRAMPEEHPYRKTPSVADLMRKRAADEAAHAADRAARDAAREVVERWNPNGRSRSRRRCGPRRSGAPSWPERRGSIFIVPVVGQVGRLISAPWTVTRSRRSVASCLACGARGVAK
jgi:hypothetical protein